MATNDGGAPPVEGRAEAFAQAFTMIIFSEIGDKTFLIAAILAMRHPRSVVFAGAFGSLVVMSILSAALGHILPSLIPKRWTQAVAAVLFLAFGVKMFLEGRAMSGGNEKIQEEMREAEEEIEGDEAEHDGTGRVENGGSVIPLEEIEEGGRAANGVANGHARRSSISKEPVSNSPLRRTVQGVRNLCSYILGPVFVQAFALTFLGEWGDRSQIATIVLAAAHNVYLVTIGTIVGHSCCTALAVIAGRYVATKISAKHVTLGGAALFLCFGVIYIYSAYQMTDVEMHIPSG